MSENAIKAAEYVAEQVVNALGGYGLFGVELFVKVTRSSSTKFPRPHDTGMVTLISQELSEFALHVRAFTGLPIGQIVQYGPSASAAILGQGQSQNIQFNGLDDALSIPHTQVRLFGKPDIAGRRRLGVALSRGKRRKKPLIARLSVRKL